MHFIRLIILFILVLCSAYAQHHAGQKARQIRENAAGTGAGSYTNVNLEFCR